MPRTTKGFSYQNCAPLYYFYLWFVVIKVIESSRASSIVTRKLDVCTISFCVSKLHKNTVPSVSHRHGAASPQRGVGALSFRYQQFIIRSFLPHQLQRLHNFAFLRFDTADFASWSLSEVNSCLPYRDDTGSEVVQVSSRVE